MAIHPDHKPSQNPEESSFVHIEAWAEDAIQALASLAVSEAAAPASRGATVALGIPLDDHPSYTAETVQREEPVRRVLVPRTDLSRRDSLKRRETLLKGSEGSRRRQRWENDRLLGNPYAQPPLPSDWEVRPTHRTQAVPYYLAPLWEAKYAKLEKERKAKEAKVKQERQATAGNTGSIPRDLKQQLKRSKGARGMLQDLEEQVREFVRKWEDKENRMAEEGIIEPDSEDDEVVFVGRNGQMHDMPSPRSSAETLEREALILQGYEDDHGGRFARWLLHNIGDYYGLKTWSVNVGNPVRREAYVGLKDVKLKAGRGTTSISRPLPRPLYAMV